MDHDIVNAQQISYIELSHIYNIFQTKMNETVFIPIRKCIILYKNTII